MEGKLDTGNSIYTARCGSKARTQVLTWTRTYWLLDLGFLATQCGMLVTQTKLTETYIGQLTTFG